MTDSPKLPSTEGSGYMNTDNYEQFSAPKAQTSPQTYNRTFVFDLPTSYNGFYLAAQDTGSCLAISRVRVYRFNCKARKTGLVLRPDTPANGTDTASVKFSCVPNGDIIGPDTVNCTSKGEWLDETPVCGCKPGYEINMNTKDKCDICPKGQYQNLLSPTEQCKPCPAQSSARDPGTAVCVCDDGFFRHPDKPDDACLKSPSAPLFDLSKPPVLEGTDITAIWQPPVEPGGDPEGLYFDIYTAQLEEGENPTFCRQNKAPVDSGGLSLWKDKPVSIGTVVFL
jgi:hypothetical protein